LTSGAAQNTAPAWSPDGTKIAFVSTRDDPNPASCNPCNTEIYVMDADGGNPTRLTNDPAADGSPAWSPDATKITFDSTRTGGGDIYTMNADGTNVVRLTTGSSFDRDPAWSPADFVIVFTTATQLWRMASTPGPPGYSPTPITAGDFPVNPDWSPNLNRIAYQEHACCDPGDSSQQISTIPPNGTTPDVLALGTAPAWSPDGSRIAFGEQTCFASGSLYFCGDKDIDTMNTDGTGVVNLTHNPSGEASGQPSWQPIPWSYVRPKGASPFRASLVPAYKQCSAPNETHGSPLTFGSCNPPQPASSFLTVGTPDANGQAANSASYAQMKTLTGDVRLDVSVTDVRNKVGLSDYTGQLRIDTAVRLTDSYNTPNPGGPGPGTGLDTHFPFIVLCAGTADATLGSTCSISTTANAVEPGVVAAGRRAIWQLGPVEVYDGGSSGASNASDSTLFMDQGVFVP
jgi:Tol biopolymer transport system component